MKLYDDTMTYRARRCALEAFAPLPKMDLPQRSVRGHTLVTLRIGKAIANFHIRIHVASTTALIRERPYNHSAKVPVLVSFGN